MQVQNARDVWIKGPEAGYGVELLPGKWLKSWFFALLAVSAAGPGQARYVQTVKARYATEAGTSDWYTVPMIFMTGTELNTATRTLDYDGLTGRYGIIFWTQHETSVIEIDDMLFCGTTATQACIAGHIGDLTGTDQESRKWEICTGALCY